MRPPALSRADLHLLHVFSTVVEKQGFSAAQIELNVSASTISRQISDLEIRLGTRLCDRGRRGFRLTRNGELVYRAAQRLFASVREFSDAVDGPRGKMAGTLSVAVIDNWVFNDRSGFSQALRSLVHRAPEVTIELFSLAPDDVELAVQDGRVALGIGVFHRHKPGLVYRSIGFEEIGLYCGRDHPLFGKTDPAEVEAGIAASQYATRAYLRERDVAPVSRGLRSNAFAHQIEGIAHFILTGRYLGYLPRQLADVWVRQGKMASVGGGRYDQPSELKLVKRRGAQPDLVARTFEGLITGADS